ncbi:hypothetical protein G6F60_013845 [Rhizopus arrhizus]|nr:hypothetical protein G6F60_013845 [Rhizopus arrhizus]
MVAQPLCGQRMLALALAKGVAPERAVLLPNWIDVNAITPRADGGDYRAELGIPQDAIVALPSACRRHAGLVRILRPGAGTRAAAGAL